MQRPQWWAGLDSNQRSAFARQIYSLVPLTTRPPTLGAYFLDNTRIEKGLARVRRPALAALQRRAEAQKRCLSNGCIE